jgi:hypothetical protein
MTHDTREIPVASPAWSWWEAHRLNYGLALVAAGLFGFAIQATVMLIQHGQAVPPMEMVRMFLLQGVIYGVYMIVAHVLYLLGPLIETMLKPQPVATFRRGMWTLGTVTAAGLPLLVAIFIAVMVGFVPRGLAAV